MRRSLTSINVIALSRLLLLLLLLSPSCSARSSDLLTEAAMSAPPAVISAPYDSADIAPVAIITGFFPATIFASASTTGLTITGTNLSANSMYIVTIVAAGQACGSVSAPGFAASYIASDWECASNVPFSCNKMHISLIYGETVSNPLDGEYDLCTSHSLNGPFVKTNSPYSLRVFTQFASLSSLTPSTVLTAVATVTVSGINIAQTYSVIAVPDGSDCSDSAALMPDVIRVVVNSINLDGTQMTVNVVPKVVGKYTLCATILTGSTYTPKYTALASTPLTISPEAFITTLEGNLVKILIALFIVTPVAVIVVVVYFVLLCGKRSKSPHVIRERISFCYWRCCCPDSCRGRYVVNCPRALYEKEEEDEKDEELASEAPCSCKNCCTENKDSDFLKWPRRIIRQEYLVFASGDGATRLTNACQVACSAYQNYQCCSSSWITNNVHTATLANSPLGCGAAFEYPFSDSDANVCTCESSPFNLWLMISTFSALASAAMDMILSINGAAYTMWQWIIYFFLSKALLVSHTALSIALFIGYHGSDPCNFAKFHDSPTTTALTVNMIVAILHTAYTFRQTIVAFCKKSSADRWKTFYVIGFECCCEVPEDPHDDVLGRACCCCCKGRGGDGSDLENYYDTAAAAEEVAEEEEEEDRELVAAMHGTSDSQDRVDQDATGRQQLQTDYAKMD